MGIILPSGQEVVSDNPRTPDGLFEYIKIEYFGDKIDWPTNGNHQERRVNLGEGLRIETVCNSASLTIKVSDSMRGIRYEATLGADGRFYLWSDRTDIPEKGGIISRIKNLRR